MTQKIDGEQAVIQSGSIVTSRVDDIQSWGIARGITVANGATALSQIAKLKKEVFELEVGLINQDAKEIKDGIGDCLVVLVQIARLTELTWNECLAQAWNDIKDRKGQMACGIFVKEADLVLPGLVEALKDCESAQDVEDAIDAAKSSNIIKQLNKGTN